MKSVLMVCKELTHTGGPGTDLHRRLSSQQAIGLFSLGLKFSLNTFLV